MVCYTEREDVTMKKVFLILCLTLLCCLVYANAEPNEIDLIDEWIAFPYMERQCYIGKEIAGHYFIGNDEVTVATEENVVTLSVNGDDDFSGVCILKDENFAILAANGDQTSIMFATIKKSMENEVNSWRVYFLEGKASILFTQSRMLSGNLSFEYIFRDNRLFVVQGDSYSKGIIEVISDDIFILKAEMNNDASIDTYVGNPCVLFIRSSLI